MDWCDFFKNTVPTYIPTIITGIVAILGSILLYRTSSKERRMRKAENLKKQLESFYYPFYLRSKQNTEIRKALYRDGYPIRLLNALLDDFKFDDNDKVLINEIKNNDKELNELILSKLTIISNLELSEKLAQLSSHYTLFILACEGKIKGDSERFKDYVHPNGVRDDVEKEIKKIEKRVEELNK